MNSKTIISSTTAIIVNRFRFRFQHLQFVRIIAIVAGSGTSATVSVSSAFNCFLINPTVSRSQQQARAMSGCTCQHLSTSALYEPHRMYASLYQDTFKEEWLHNDFKEIIRALPPKKGAYVASEVEKTEEETQRTSSETLSPADNEKWIIPHQLKQEMGDVYSFKCFSSDFVRMFNDEIENFYSKAEEYNIPIRRPNTMSRYGVILNQIGMRNMITSFQKKYLWPLARTLWPREGSQFDDHHSFIVRYRAEEDLGLDMHTDDSDVTFNVCLGEVFTGATLTFCGMFGAPDHRHHSHTYQHEVGQAVLHLGTRRHGADDIKSGRRSNLIVWNHNHEWRASPEHRRRRTLLYEKEKSPPDKICLSYTHDRDYEIFQELPSQARNIHSHPWCPPRGHEYPEFDSLIKKSQSSKEV